jgi:hypothetical protein
MADYLATPAVSAGDLWTLLTRCPRAAWYESAFNPNQPEQDSKPEQDTGSIAHAILLEGSESIVAVVDPNAHPAEKGGAIPTGWTNKSIKAWRAAQIAAGKIPIFPGKLREIRAMVDAARDYIDSLRSTEPAIYRAFQPDGGQSEVTIVWQDELGIAGRIRPDRLAIDRGLEINYKTGATAEPMAWGRRQMIGTGLYMKAAWYRRGMRAAFQMEVETVYLVQEQLAPFLCSLVGLDPAAKALGEQRMLSASREWAACAHAGSWRGYPARAVYPELPPWEFQKAEDEASDAALVASMPDEPAAQRVALP